MCKVLKGFTPKFEFTTITEYLNLSIFSLHKGNPVYHDKIVALYMYSGNTIGL